MIFNFVGWLFGQEPIPCKGKWNISCQEPALRGTEHFGREIVERYGNGGETPEHISPCFITVEWAQSSTPSPWRNIARILVRFLQSHKVALTLRTVNIPSVCTGRLQALKLSGTGLGSEHGGQWTGQLQTHSSWHFFIFLNLLKTLSFWTSVLLVV